MHLQVVFVELNISEVLPLDLLTFEGVRNKEVYCSMLASVAPSGMIYSALFCRSINCSTTEVWFSYETVMGQRSMVHLSLTNCVNLWSP